ncbi:hypothetical protein [Polymorphum gilvum]|uniref:Uncharacterized protein n=1 Tax=Polymorphum gilvum (strain LMG 25793 / CGMCC 1.9160 / SL003B-26A1) TaxID=991905 RepID=F2IZH9_POLGS|nr:hypothetical protein [Polymorphum gilvum]ADZ68603.1 hypothetical protein SL003B_0163 [Polymorphum gilvum SL003B-26A1]
MAGAEALPAAPSAGDPEFYLNTIQFELGDHGLSEDARDYLYTRIADATRQQRASLAEEARLLEFEENCRLVGRLLREALEGRGTVLGVVELDDVETMFFRLCPGLYPFC